MTERDRPISDAELDRLIAEARAAEPAPRPDFLLALTEQAVEAMAPPRRTGGRAGAAPARPGWGAPGGAYLKGEIAGHNRFNAANVLRQFNGQGALGAGLHLTLEGHYAV